MWWQSKAAVNIKHSIPKAPGALRVCGESCRRDTPKILPPFNCSCLAAYLGNKNRSWNAKCMREPGPRTTSIQVPLRHQKTERKRETGKDQAQIEGLKCLDKWSSKIKILFFIYFLVVEHKCVFLKRKTSPPAVREAIQLWNFWLLPFSSSPLFALNIKELTCLAPICSSDRSSSLKALWFSWCRRHKLGSPFS